jgi:T5SS/PEP-CTERM-associated repeat protein
MISHDPRRADAGSPRAELNQQWLNRVGSRRLAIIYVLASAWWLVSSASPSVADEDFWKTAASGTWGAGGSWVDGTTPGVSDSATFNLPGTYTVSFNATPDPIRGLSITNGGNLTFASSSRPPNPIVPRTLPVTSVPGLGNVFVTSGATLTLGALGGIQGSQPLHLTSRQLDVFGTLNVRFGSDVNVIDGHLSIGGQLNVNGSGSTITTHSSGFNGSTIVNAGGFMQTSDSSIGVGSVGAVTVSGVGSRWISSGILQIGANSILSAGQGTVSVTGGGLVESANALVGGDGLSNGTVTVTDSGSRWNTTNLSIGLKNGPGTLNIQPGGTSTVGLDTVIGPQGRLRLQGGTFDTRVFSIEGVGGQFEWTAGTLHVETYHGDLVQPAGILAPGHSAGSTTILGNYTQQSPGTLEIEIGGAAQGTQYDIVNVTGNVLLGGRLDLNLINGFVPTPSQTLVILSTSTSLSGAFSNAANGQRLTTIDGGGSFLVNYGAGSAFDPTLIVLSGFQSGGLPGDFNQNGIVDAADYVVWRNNEGTTTTLPNDPIGGTIGQAQYDQWRASFGLTASGSGSGVTLAAANASVPEPASLALMMFAFAALALNQPRAARSMTVSTPRMITGVRTFCRVRAFVGSRWSWHALGLPTSNINVNES